MEGCEVSGVVLERKKKSMITENGQKFRFIESRK